MHKKTFRLNALILLEDLPPEEDTFFSTIKSIQGLVDVLLIDEYGDNTGGASINKSDYRRRRILSKRDPRYAISQKMVRHLGHFQKMTRVGEKCVRHFYDGRFCVAEIADYLFVELQPDFEPDAVICYHSVLSPWLVDSMLSLKSKLECEGRYFM